MKSGAELSPSPCRTTISRALFFSSVDEFGFKHGMSVEQCRQISKRELEFEVRPLNVGGCVAASVVNVAADVRRRILTRNLPTIARLRVKSRPRYLGGYFVTIRVTFEP